MVDRLYRQGQTAKMVMVYRLIAEGTIEQEVSKRLEYKMEEEYNVKKSVKEKGDSLRN